MKPMLSFKVTPCRTEAKLGGLGRGRRKHLTPKNPRVKIVKPSGAEVKWVKPEFSDHSCSEGVAQNRHVRKRRPKISTALPFTATGGDCCAGRENRSLGPSENGSRQSRGSSFGHVHVTRNMALQPSHVTRPTSLQTSQPDDLVPPTPQKSHVTRSASLQTSRSSDLVPPPHTRVRGSFSSHPPPNSTAHRKDLSPYWGPPTPCEHGDHSHLEITSIPVGLQTPPSPQSPTHLHPDETILATNTPSTPQRSKVMCVGNVDCINETPLAR